MLGEFANPLAIIVSVVAFCLAGVVKGTIGGGLPSLAIPIMVSVVEPALAAALTFVPVLLTNFWQAMGGGFAGGVVRRFWPYLVPLALGVWIGTQILVGASPKLVALLIGILVIAMSSVSLLRPNFSISIARQRWLNPTVGGILGVLGGATAMFAPSLVYFSALRLPKDLFVAAMGVVALWSTIPLYLSLGLSDALGVAELKLSALAAIPALIGMRVGMAIRSRIDQDAFQRLLGIGLIVIGLDLVRNAWWSGSPNGEAPLP